MSDMQDNNAWTKIGTGCWGYGARYSFGWSDPRVAFSTRPYPDIRDVGAAISCVGPDAWVIYIRGEHRAQVESWDEAKSVAALLYNVEETS